MKLKLAESAGFCFGVNRAVSEVFKLIESGEKNIMIMGELIHNPYINRKIKEAGVEVIDTPEEAKDGATLIIRTHGITKDNYDKLKKKDIKIIDLTCPFVSKIQKKAEEAEKNGATILIFGHAEHPEVAGIVSHCRNAYVFDSLDSFKKIALPKDEKLHIVSQTTMNQNDFNSCVDYAKKIYTNLFISDTICNATIERQEEAEKLAKQCDFMVVIGGKNSSNTTRLFEVAKTYCPATFLIEDADDVPLGAFSENSIVGVTAGASTPKQIIDSVCKKILEVK